MRKRVPEDELARQWAELVGDNRYAVRVVTEKRLAIERLDGPPHARLTDDGTLAWWRPLWSPEQEQFYK